MTSIVQRKKKPEEIAREQALRTISTKTAAAPAPATKAVAAQPAPVPKPAAQPAVTAKPAAQPAPAKVATQPKVTATPAPTPAKVAPTGALAGMTQPRGGMSSGMANPAGGGGINVGGAGNRGNEGGTTSPIYERPSRNPGTRAPGPVGPGGMPINTSTGTLPGAAPGGQVGTPVQATTPPPAPLPGSEWGDGGVLNPGTGPKPSGPSSIDAMAEELARKQLAAALAGGNVDAIKSALAERSADATGRSIVNARAAGGRQGMAMSGSLAAQANDIRQNAGRDLTLAQFGAQTAEEQRLLGNANESQRIDIMQRTAASNLADAQARRAAMEALLGGPGTAPPTAPGPGGGKTGAEQIGEALDGAGGALAGMTGIDDGTSVFGKGTDQTELASSPENEPATLDRSDPSQYRAASSPPSGYRETQRVQDAQGRTWVLYTNKQGDTVRVAASNAGSTGLVR